jgi:replicative DNA helicase
MTSTDQERTTTVYDPNDPIGTPTKPAVVDPLVPHEDENWLGALLGTYAHTSLRAEALREVAPAEFYNPHLGGLWAAARVVQDRGDRITRRALLGTLAAQDKGTVSAGRALDELASTVVVPGDYRRVVLEVKRCARLRAVRLALDEARGRLLKAEDADQALTWATDLLGELDADQAAPDVRAFGDLLDDWRHALDEPDASHWTIPTPWSDINDLTAGGLHGGRMYVVGARPGEGKSIAAHRMAVYAAEGGHPSLVFSMELDAPQVTGRMVAGATRIEMTEISRRSLTAKSYHTLDGWLPGARSWPLWINDKPSITVDYIKAVCRAQKRRTGLRVVAVDYLQMVNASDRRQQREQQVAEISRQLKQLARELDIAIIVPAQLNRAMASRGDGTPKLSDLRESGGIEADADVVMLLARSTVSAEDVKARPELSGMVGEFDGNIDVVFAKNRLGPTCTRTLVWRGHYMSLG